MLKVIKPGTAPGIGGCLITVDTQNRLVGCDLGTVHQLTVAIPAPGIHHISLLGQALIPLKDHIVVALGGDGGDPGQVTILDHCAAAVGTGTARREAGIGLTTAGAHIGVLRTGHHQRRHTGIGHSDARGAQTQLTHRILAPGIHIASPGQSQGVAGAGGYSNDLFQMAVSGGVIDLLGRNLAADIVAQTQLFIGIKTPTVNTAVGTGDHAVVIAAGNADHVGHVTAAPVAPDADGMGPAAVAVITQLAAVILAPTVDLAVLGQSQGPQVTGRHLKNVLHPVAGIVQSHYQLGRRSVGPVTGTQLALIVAAPSVHIALGGDRQTVVVTRSHIDHYLIGRDLDLNGVILDLFAVGVGAAGTVLIRHAVAQLAIGIVAPCPQGTVALQCQGKVLAAGYHGYSLHILGQNGHQHGSRIGVSHRIIAGDLGQIHIEVDDHTAIGVRIGGRDGPPILSRIDGRYDGNTFIRALEGDGQRALLALQIAVKVKSFIVDRQHLLLVQNVLIAIVHLNGSRRLVDSITEVLLGITVSVVIDKLGPGGLQSVVILSAQLDGLVLLLIGEVAQLPVAIVTPAVSVALMVHRHGVDPPGADILGPAKVVSGLIIGVLTPEDLHRHQSIRGIGGSVTGSILRINTQLTHIVGAPAVKQTALGHQQAIGSAAGDPDHIFNVVNRLAHIRVQTHGGDLHRQSVVSRSLSVAQLAVLIPAPSVKLDTFTDHCIGAGIDLMLLAQRQHKLRTGIHIHNVAQELGHVAQVIEVISVGIVLGRGILAIGRFKYRVGVALAHRRVVAALAVVVASPSEYRTVGAQGHVHMTVDRDIHNVVKVFRSNAQAVAHPLRRSVGRSGVAQGIAALAADIVVQVGQAPGQDCAVLQQDQGVVCTHRHLDHARQIVGGAGGIFHAYITGMSGLIVGVPEGAVSSQYPLGNGRTVSDRANAQLALTVAAPSVHIAVGGQRQGMILAGAGDLTAGRNIHDGVVIGRDLAQQTVAVHTHDLHGCIEGIGVDKTFLLIIIVVGHIDRGCEVVSRQGRLVSQRHLHILRRCSSAKGVGGQIDNRIRICSIDAAAVGIPVYRGAGGIGHAPVNIPQSAHVGKGPRSYGPDALLYRQSGKDAVLEGAGRILQTDYRQGIRYDVSRVGEGQLAHGSGNLQGNHGLTHVGKTGDGRRAAVAVGSGYVKQPLIVSAHDRGGGGLVGHQSIQLRMSVILPGEGVHRGSAGGLRIHTQQSPVVITPGPHRAVPLDGKGVAVTRDHLSVGDDGGRFGIDAFIIDIHCHGTPKLVGAVHHIDHCPTRPVPGGGNGDKAGGIGSLVDGNDTGITAEPVEVSRSRGLHCLIPVKVIAFIAFLDHLGGIDTERLAYRKIHRHRQVVIADSLAPAGVAGGIAAVGSRVVENGVIHPGLDMGIRRVDDILTVGQGHIGRIAPQTALRDGCRDRTLGDLHQAGSPAAHQDGGILAAADRTLAQLPVVVLAPGVNITVHCGHKRAVAAGADIQHTGKVIDTIHILLGSHAGQDPVDRHAPGDLISANAGVGSHSVAQRAIAVGAPGIYGTRIAHGHIVDITGADLADDHSVGDIDLHRGPGDHIVPAVPVGSQRCTGIILDHRSSLIATPDKDLAALQVITQSQGHAVSFTGADADDPLQSIGVLLTALDPYRHKAGHLVISGIGNGGIAVGSHTLSQLIAVIGPGGQMPIMPSIIIAVTQVVLAPGKDLAVRAQRQREFAAGGNGNHPVQIVIAVGGIDLPQIHKVACGGLAAHHMDGDHTGLYRGIIVAQLTVSIVAPRPHGPVTVQSQGMIPAGGNSHNEGGVKALQLTVTARRLGAGSAHGASLMPFAAGITDQVGATESIVLIIGVSKIDLYRHRAGTRNHIGIAAPSPHIAFGVQRQIEASSQGRVGIDVTIVVGAGAVIVTAAGSHSHDILQLGLLQVTFTACHHTVVAHAACRMAVTTGITDKGHRGLLHLSSAARSSRTQVVFRTCPHLEAGITHQHRILFANQDRGGERIAVGSTITVHTAGTIAPGPDRTIGPKGQRVGAACSYLRHGHVLHIPLLSGVGDPADVDPQQDHIALTGGGICIGHDSSGGAHLRSSGKGHPTGGLGVIHDAAVQHLNIQAVKGNPLQYTVCVIIVPQLIPVIKVEPGEILVLDLIQSECHALVCIDPHQSGTPLLGCGIAGNTLDIKVIQHHQVQGMGPGLDGIDMLIYLCRTQAVILIGAAEGPDGTVCLQGHAVLIPGGNGPHRAQVIVPGPAGTQTAGHLNGRGSGILSPYTVTGGGNTQLSVGVVAPGIEDAILCEGKALIIAGSNTDNDLLIGSLTGAAQLIRVGGSVVHRVRCPPDPPRHIVLEAHVGAPDAQLALRVIAHAVDLGPNAQAGVRGQIRLILLPDQDQGMVPAGSHSHCVLHIIALALALALEHLYRQAIAVVVAQAQLAAAVFTPGKYSTVAADGSRVVKAGGNADHTVEIVAVRGALALQDLPRREATGLLVAYTQLAKAIGTERPDLAAQAGGSRFAGAGGGLGILGQDQGMVGARGHGYGELRRSVIPCQFHRSSVQGGGFIAQLSIGIDAGGIDLAIPGQHHQVGLARGDGDHVGQILPLAQGTVGQKLRRDLHLGGYGPGDGGAVAQLSGVVQAPGPHRTIGAQPGGKPVARGQHGRGNAHRLRIILLLGHSDVDGSGVGDNGTVGGTVGQPDHSVTHPTGSDGRHTGGGGADVGYRGVGGDPLHLAGRIYVRAAHRQGAAVHQQIEGRQIGLQQVIDAAVLVINGEGVALLHGDVHGGQQCRIGQFAQAVVLGAAIRTLDRGLIDHQGPGLHVAHLHGLTGNVVGRQPVGAHDALYIACIGTDVGHPGVVAPGVDKAVGPDGKDPILSRRHGQHALELRGGVGVKGIALQHPDGLFNTGKAGVPVIVDAASGIVTDTQLAQSGRAPSISVAALVHGNGKVIAHMDAGNITQPLYLLCKRVVRGPLVHLARICHHREGGACVHIHYICNAIYLYRLRLAVTLVQKSAQSPQQIAPIGRYHRVFVVADRCGGG